jgi:hypothetical protein
VLKLSWKLDECKPLVLGVLRDAEADSTARARMVGRCRLNPVEARFERDWFQCWKLTSDDPLSNFAFSFNVCRYSMEGELLTALEHAAEDRRRAEAAAQEVAMAHDRCSESAAAAECMQAGAYTRPHLSSF